uniref:Exportin-2 n=1 Tax=Chenopodium quinoa TaxID=63459 RepID=A0A803LF22_CHEQI
MLNNRLQQAFNEGGINGILGTANTLFKKFRHGYGTNELRLDLRYCLDNMAVPLLRLFSHTASVIDSGRTEEPFGRYVGEFEKAVRGLLITVSRSPGRDHLAITAIKFLTMVSTMAHHYKLFNDASLDQICRSIVIPNVMLHEEDEELFEFNYIEFIRRDMEGSDVDTKRRAACELLKGIATHYREKSQDVNSYPLLKACALKFLTVFRDQLPKSSVMALLPEVLRFLGAESNVIHSYAAIFIDKVLLVKDEGGRARYVASDIAPFLPVLLNNLFISLKFPESEENQYVMKCIMRVLGGADVSGHVAATCMSGMASILNKVCKNPKNPIFNHYLFETFAVLIRRVCDKEPSVISLFETSLFPSLETILANNVIEFFPYAFQLLAQLVELNRPPLPQNYMQFCNYLLLPDPWTKSADVPALVRLLQAFLRMVPNELELDKVLLYTRSFFLTPGQRSKLFLCSTRLLRTLGTKQLLDIFHSFCLCCLTISRITGPQSLLGALSYFMSLIIVKHGWNNLVDAFEGFDRVQPGILLTILELFWVPNLKQITGAIETKLTAVASTKLLCECPALLKPESSKVWVKC